MAINYPASLDDGTSLPIVVDNVDNVLAVHQNDPRLSIIALETKLGIGASTPATGKIMVATGTGTSAWGDVALDGLSDVSVAAPIAGDHLVWNGTTWIASAASSVVGSANSFFPDNTASLADNKTLTTTPTSYSEVINTVTVSSALSPVFYERFVSGPLGRTSIPAGTWTFNIWTATNNVGGSNLVKFRVNKRIEQTGMTGTFTGAGATRTFTVTGGTPFVAGDANADRLLASLIETPTQTAWISGFTSSSEVTVTLTDPGFVNVSGVNLNAIYKYLFSTDSGELDATGATLHTVTSVQSAFTGLNLTDRLVIAFFAFTDGGSRTQSIYYGGTTHFSYFSSPISTLHNDLAGLNVGDYLHLTAAEYTRFGTIVKASGAELDTGTDDVKFATAKAINDSHNVPSVAPGTSGNIMTSNGTDWTSAAPASNPFLLVQVFS